MKKMLCLLLMIVFITTGCGKTNEENILDKVSSVINNSKSYLAKGNMEIYTDEETLSYSIELSYLEDNYYKAQMVNQINNHEQIILRDKESVYVITPSLNKSFKFQSDWPNNSSQAYILKNIYNDINEDSAREIVKEDNNYIIKAKVDYPNNPELSYQKTTVNENGEIKKNEVYDSNDKLKIKVVFTSVDYKANLKEEDFNINDYVTTDCEDEDCESESTGLIEDILYPLYVPTNTYLTGSDTLTTDTGNRVILTFSGDKNFILVEEAASVSKEFEVTPIYGDPLFVSDTIGALGTNSLTWTSNDISYYLASSDLSNDELLTIASSIGNNSSTVSVEK